MFASVTAHKFTKYFGFVQDFHAIKNVNGEVLSFIFLHFLKNCCHFNKKGVSTDIIHTHLKDKFAINFHIMCYLARHNVNDPESVREGFGALSKRKIEGDDGIVK